MFAIVLAAGAVTALLAVLGFVVVVVFVVLGFVVVVFVVRHQAHSLRHQESLVHAPSAVLRLAQSTSLE